MANDYVLDFLKRASGNGLIPEPRILVEYSMMNEGDRTEVLGDLSLRAEHPNGIVEKVTAMSLLKYLGKEEKLFKQRKRSRSRKNV